MRIKFGRAVVAAIAAEIGGVAILALLVAAFGPGGGIDAATPFAERLGAWVGPISGFVLCLLGGWWTAKAAADSDRVLNGFAMGTLGAALDIAIAAPFVVGVPFLLVLSNAGRVVGGTLGGWIARKRPG